jgi:hypothetical protein
MEEFEYEKEPAINHPPAKEDQNAQVVVSKLSTATLNPVQNHENYLRGHLGYPQVQQILLKMLLVILKNDLDLVVKLKQKILRVFELNLQKKRNDIAGQTVHAFEVMSIEKIPRLIF